MCSREGAARHDNGTAISYSIAHSAKPSAAVVHMELNTKLTL